jgi:hypothetical protein
LRTQPAEELSPPKMVKTRAQLTVANEEAQRARTIPDSALPPKVCRTPPGSSKRPPAIASNRNQSAKKKKLAFAADAPTEFKFDLMSPPARRLHHDNHNVVHESVVRLEFEARAGSDTAPSEIGEKEREKYKEWISRDLKQELRLLHGLDCDHFSNDVKELETRKELAECLRRRAEIRRTLSSGPYPSEMNLKDLQSELHKRRIAFPNLTHYQASEALERALLKEDAQGLIGDGYQFGRRLVSAADVISFYQPTDKEMRVMLESRALKGKDIPRTKTQKLELLSRFIELEQEQLVRKLVKDELIREHQRRKIKCDSDEHTDMFEALFQSTCWKSNYDDVDNTPFDPSKLDDRSGSCTIC